MNWHRQPVERTTVVGQNRQPQNRFRFSDGGLDVMVETLSSTLVEPFDGL
jgi:hypothetical protein